MEDQIGIVLCKDCRAIISTDVHLLQEVVEKDVVIFAKCSVDMRKDVIVSHDSFDKYCTYQQLLCRGCHHPVGKIYRALNDELIYMLNKYIMDKNALVFGIYEEKCLDQKQKQEEHEKPMEGKIEVEIDVKKYDPLIPDELDEYYGMKFLYDDGL